ncbi:Putative ankyrin repeat protein MM_0045, partial [Durusdinium trenchii]
RADRLGHLVWPVAPISTTDGFQVSGTLQTTLHVAFGLLASLSGFWAMVIFRDNILQQPLRWNGFPKTTTKVRKSLKKEAGTTRPVACKPIQQEEMRLANTATSRSAKKKMRAVNRMDVRPDPLEGMTSLQLASVSKECLSRYKRCWSSVKQKLLTCKGKLKATTTVDTILSRELDNLYHDGEDVSAGEYLIAAVVFFNICLKSPAMQKLPQVKQSLKGWRKMAPQRSRLPVPWEVTSLLIQKPIDKGLMGLALHMGLMFALYLRPSEGLRLSARDVVPPVLKGQGNYRHWTVVLRPEGEVKGYVKNGAKLDAQDLYGWTALRYAVRADQVEAAEALIEGGADMNLSSKSGRTPLMSAASNGIADMVKLLLDAGADAKAVDSTIFEESEVPCFCRAS